MYENLVADLRKAADEWRANHLSVPTFETRYDLALLDAAGAIESMCEMVATAYCENANIIASYEESKPRWIPVTEQLPEPFDRVIVYDKRWGVLSAMKGEDDSWGGRNDIVIEKVTHWMPLPTPPEEET